jgi:hypothetical protein
MKAPIVWIEYIDGPLDGLRSAVEAAVTKNLYIGWCFNSTRGVVQALYVRETPTKWRFHEYSAGPRGGGYPAAAWRASNGQPVADKCCTR